MPNLRGKTWTTTTPAYVEDAQYWEDHLISDAVATKAANSVQSVNSTTPDANGNVDIVALPNGGTVGQVLTKKSSTDGDADWEDPASSGHIIEDEDGTTMTQQPTLQFTNAEVTNDSVNSKTIVDCKGTKGDPGDAATVTVGTVTTLPAGSSATVTNSGTSSAAVFNFGIPKGADGTGAGDMLKADYDSDSAVELAGGIASYVASQAYSLPTASTSILGGVKVGTNLSIDGNGVLSATDTKALASMTDVAISSASDGQALVYDSNTNKWKNGGAPASALEDLTDVNITSASNGQVLTYDSATSKWKNGTASAGGGSTVTITTNEVTLRGQTVTLTDTVDTYTGTFDNTGTCIISGVTIIGTATVSASDGIDTASNTVTMPYYGKYTVSIKFFGATVTVTYPYANGATCTLSDGVTTLTATTSPMAFVVPNTGTWVATCTLDGQSKTQSFVITTDGQTESHTFEYGEIDLIFDNEFRGLNITCVNGGTVITKQAPIAGNSMTFYPPSTGEWVISGTYSGVPYSTSATIVSLSTAVSATLQTNVTVTVTLYGATEDTISFTDAVGAKTAVFETGQSSKSVSIVIPPSGMSITFTSSVAKNPSDLTADYSKTVSITNATTEVKVMPNNALYWYGYLDSNFGDAKANGYSVQYRTLSNATFNTNDISLASDGNTSGVGTNNTIDITSVNSIKVICKYNKTSGTFAGFLNASSKAITDAMSKTGYTNNNAITLYTRDVSGESGNQYIMTFGDGQNTTSLYAMWLE